MKTKLIESFNNAYDYIERNNTTILTGLGIAGVVGTAVLAVKGKPKADKLLKEKEEYKRLHYNEDLTRFETFLAVVPAYIPAILMGVGTSACILGAHNISKEREAALISAYSYLNTSYNEYKDKVKELFGEEKEQQVRDAIAQSHKTIKKEEDTLLLYDEYGKRYFNISPAKYNDALYKLNRMYNFTGEMTLNNFYEFFDLDPIPGGDVLGWSALKDFECTGISWIDVTLRPMEMPDDCECFAMEYNVEPSDDIASWINNLPY